MERKKRVVILEDDNLSKALLSYLMNNKGYEVFTYENPTICPFQISKECRCNNNERCTDIILSDLNMPGLSGLEYFSNQRVKGCKCQNIALVTDDINIDVAQKATKLSCKLFSKPVDYQEISGWLREIDDNFDYDVKLSNWFQN